jgi:hypothetical protein
MDLGNCCSILLSYGTYQRLAEVIYWLRLRISILPSDKNRRKAEEMREKINLKAWVYDLQK